VGRRQEEGSRCAADDPPSSGSSRNWWPAARRSTRQLRGLPPPDGKGAGPIKALDGSAVVLDADKAKQIAILLNGANNGAMPAWKQLSDTELAAVITYTKNSWGNKTGQLVQPSEVVAARK
jgi:hypothetical protein